MRQREIATLQVMRNLSTEWITSVIRTYIEPFCQSERSVYGLNRMELLRGGTLINPHQPQAIHKQQLTSACRCMCDAIEK